MISDTEPSAVETENVTSDLSKSNLYDKENARDDSPVPLSSATDEISPIPSKPMASSSGHYVASNQDQKQENKTFPCSEDKFQLRIGPNYEASKKKAVSPPALFDFVGSDVHTSSKVLENMGERVTIPSDWIVDTFGSGVPPVLVISHFIPSDCSLQTVFTNMFTNMTDGASYCITCYFRLSESTRKALADVSTAPPAVKLLVDYCRNAPTVDNDDSPYKGRFKFICNTLGLEELGVPSFIRMYNSKPGLIRNSGKMFRGARNEYLEMDLNFFTFGSIFRRGVATMLSSFERLEVCMGYCIESRSDEEMPETLLCAFTFFRPMLSRLQPWTDDLAKQSE